MKHTDTGGYALLSVILALIIIIVLATGALFTANQESRVAIAGENADEALYVAENGVAEVLADWDSPDLDSLENWETLTLTGTVAGQGEWEVEVLRVNEQMFFVEGRGRVYRGGQLQAGVSRSVGIAAARPKLELEPPAALTTRGPTSIEGTAEVHGEDEVPPGWEDTCSGTSDMPGITTDDADNVSTQGSGEITGSPPVAEDPGIDDATFSEFGADLSWDELTDLANVTVGPGTINTTGPSLTASGDCDKSDDLNWGDPEDPDGACGDYFPLIHAQGDYLRVQSGGVGQGILLVDGDLDLRGDFLFNGIVIVRGNFETQGSGNRVRGAVMAGNTYFDDQSITGGSVVGYSSCGVRRAIEENEMLSKPRALPMRSWSDLSRSGA